MVKPAEVREVWNHSRFHAALMIYTAVMVPATDFLIGVLSALAIYGVTYRWFDMPQEAEPALEPSFAPQRRAADRTQVADNRHAERRAS